MKPIFQIAICVVVLLLLFLKDYKDNKNKGK